MAAGDKAGAAAIVATAASSAQNLGFDIRTPQGEAAFRAQAEASTSGLANTEQARKNADTVSEVKRRAEETSIGWANVAQKKVENAIASGRLDESVAGRLLEISKVGAQAAALVTAASQTKNYAVAVRDLVANGGAPTSTSGGIATYTIAGMKPDALKNLATALGGKVVGNQISVNESLLKGIENLTGDLSIMHMTALGIKGQTDEKVKQERLGATFGDLTLGAPKEVLLQRLDRVIQYSNSVDDTGKRMFGGVQDASLKATQGRYSQPPLPKLSDAAVAPNPGQPTPNGGSAKVSIGTGTPASSLPPTDGNGWALHTDSQGRTAYVSPDGKSFKVVK
jgi:hypothetical protein